MSDEGRLAILLLAAASSAHTHRWVDALSAAGHRVVVASWQPGPKLPAADLHIAPAVSAPLGVRLALAVRWMHRLVRDIHPDVVHVHSLGSYGLLSLAVPGGPARVLSPYGGDMRAARRSAARAVMLALVLRRGDMVLPCSAELGAELRNRYKVSPARMRVLSWGVAERPRARRAQEAYLEQVRAAAGTVRNRVLIIDHPLARQQTFELMCASDIAVSIPPGDQHSYSVLEAALAGCRLLVSDIPPYREMIKDGLTADLLAEPVASALAQRLRIVSVDEQIQRRNEEFIVSHEHGADKLATHERIYRRLSTAGASGHSL